MPICMPCKKDDTGLTPDDAGVISTSSKICVRCFTFWLLVVLLALGVMAHYHDSEGNVHF